MRTVKQMTISHSDKGIILVDTRQKEGKHDTKHEQIIRLGYQLKSQKLDIGDYMLVGQDRISVDTKKDLTEIYQDVVSDKSRFMREVRRAYDNKVHLYVLVEHGGQIKNIDDVIKWQPKYGKVSSRSIRERLFRISISYGTEFMFCDKRATGRRIIEILEGKYERERNYYCNSFNA